MDEGGAEAHQEAQNDTLNRGGGGQSKGASRQAGPEWRKSGGHGKLDGPQGNLPEAEKADGPGNFKTVRNAVSPGIIIPPAAPNSSMKGKTAEPVEYNRNSSGEVNA